MTFLFQLSPSTSNIVHHNFSSCTWYRKLNLHLRLKCAKTILDGSALLCILPSHMLSAQLIIIQKLISGRLTWPGGTCLVYVKQTSRLYSDVQSSYCLVDLNLDIMVYIYNNGPLKIHSKYTISLLGKTDKNALIPTDHTEGLFQKYLSYRIINTASLHIDFKWCQIILRGVFFGYVSSSRNWFINEEFLLIRPLTFHWSPSSDHTPLLYEFQ